jgi:hypothetical protein
MIATTAYILISTITSWSSRVETTTQSTATFADKISCESAATRQDFVLKSMQLIHSKWNLTCHPYLLNEEKK